MRETKKYFFKLKNKDWNSTVTRLADLKHKLRLSERYYAHHIYKATIEPRIFKHFLKSKKCFGIDINSSIKRTIRIFYLDFLPCEVLEYIALLLNKRILIEKGKCLKTNISVVITENGPKLIDKDYALVSIWL